MKGQLTEFGGGFQIFSTGYNTPECTTSEFCWGGSYGGLDCGGLDVSSYGPPTYGGGFSSSQEKKGFALIVKETYKAPDERDDVGPYDYIRDLSSVETSVYIDPRDKELVLCFRGSVTKEDWIVSDGMIALAPFAFNATPRMVRTWKEIRRAVEEYPNYEIILVGHSLGGHIATNVYHYLSKEDDSIRFVVYNRGSSPIEVFSRRPVEHDRRHHYHSEGDWISKPFLNDQKTAHYITPAKELKLKKNPHGYVNFI
jgi:hypothetical protein